MKKIISILCLFVIASALRAQEFQVGELYYRVTSNSTPYTVEVSKLSKKSRVTTLDIPEKVDYNGTTYSVTSLGEKAFRKSKYLTSVSIPNTVEFMGNCCFEASGHLQIVTLPSSLLDISAGAFKGCTSLSTINIPSSVNSIEYAAFSGCTSLSTINIPNNLTDLQLFTFSRCTSLKSIIIPNSVTKIGWGVFSGCKFLKKIIYQGTSQQWQQITKHEKWREGSNFTIAYAPVSDKVQSVQQPLLAQDEPQVPVVEKTTITITPIPQPTTSLEMMSAVDRNIPQTNLRNEKTFVVIIANENYEQVASVPYANNDGKIFRQYCEQTLGIPAENIKLHTDATYNHTRLALSWLKDVCEVYNGDASVIFYYAGHGIPDVKDNSSYLLPADGDGRYVATAYKLDELYTTLGSMSAKSVVVFMDACFSGANRNGQMLASERGVALKSRPGQPKGNMVVFSAAQGDETALPNDAERHGMFTYYLLKKLQENKGNITLGELADYLVREVGRRSVVVSKVQTPCVTPSATLDASWREWKLK